MLKKIFNIPNTLDPDDRRRRQILDILLIGLLIFSIIGLIGTLLIFMDDSGTPMLLLIGNENLFNNPYVGALLKTITAFLVGGILLLAANRSTKVPGRLTGGLFIILFLAALTSISSPQNMAYTADIIFLVLPISIGAMVIAPEFAFVVALGICAYIWVAAPYLNPDDTYPNIYGMLGLLFVAFISWLGMSITNRATRDARRNAANLEATLNSIADGVLVLGLDGNFLSANPALLKMIPEDEIRKISSKPLEKTMQWQRKVFAISISPVPGVGSVAVFRDETRRHETERARDALLATVSHEFRTPLTVVMNYLELLLIMSKMGKIDNDTFTEHLTRAIENSKRLRQLVSNVLDQAQIQAGLLQLKQQVLNFPALLEKSRQLWDVLLKEKQLSYELNIAQGVPVEIMSDSDRLHQVLVNLIGNAIKFTNQGGVRVSVFLPKKETLCIEVADTGPGIPEEQLPDIFEAFRRGSNYAWRERQGAGLGLSIAKEIVTRMGGDISVYSTLGAGSVFTVSLPLERALKSAHG